MAKTYPNNLDHSEMCLPTIWSMLSQVRRRSNMSCGTKCALSYLRHLQSSAHHNRVHFLIILIQIGLLNIRRARNGPKIEPTEWLTVTALQHSRTSDDFISKLRRRDVTIVWTQNQRPDIFSTFTFPPRARSEEQFSSALNGHTKPPPFTFRQS